MTPPAARCIQEDLIAAVLLLHDRSVNEIVPRLSATELDQVITFVGRLPRLYPSQGPDSLRASRCRCCRRR